MGVSGHAVVPVAIADDDLEDFEEMVDELLERDPNNLAGMRYIIYYSWLNVRRIMEI